MTESTLPGLEDATPPAGPFIADLLRDALVSDDRMTMPEPDAIRACKTNAEVEALYDSWYHHVHAFLMHACLAHVLIRLEETSPNLAAGLADEVRGYLDDGGLYGELVWQWAEERGLVPEDIRTDARNRREEWLNTLPRHLQTGVELDIPAVTE